MQRESQSRESSWPLALYCAGAFISNIGTFGHVTAEGWLLLELTNSASVVGVLGMLASLPAVLMLPIGGVLADTMNRRKLMFSLYAVMLATAVTLGVLVHLDQIAPWHILGLALITSSCHFACGPAFQVGVRDVAGERVKLGVSVISAQFQAARIIGPGLAGLLISGVGVVACFYANAATYAVLLVVVLILPALANEPAKKEDVPKHTFRDGARAAWADPTIRLLLLITIPQVVFIAPIQMLLPVLVKEGFGGDAEALGIAGTAFGLGAVSGSLLAVRVSRKLKVPAVRGLTVGALAVAVGLIWVGVSGNFWIALPAITIAGGGPALGGTLAMMYIHTESPKEVTGRVTAVAGMSVFGGTALGSLGAGAVNDLLGISTMSIVCGVALAVSLALLHLISGRGRA